MLNYLRHELAARRGSILGWTIGLAFFVSLYTSVYPTMPAEMLDLNLEGIELYQALGIMEMTTFEGYLASTVFNFLGLLTGIYAVVAGVSALAGEEDSGTLELILALPLPRRQIVLVKALAISLSAAIILGLVGLFLMGALAAIQPQIETRVSASGLLAVVLGHLPILLLFMMLSLFLGAYLPNRRSATAAGLVALLASYFIDNLANIAESIQPLQRFSPFYYFDLGPAAILEGLPAGDQLLLLAVAAAFLLLALFSFERRNVTVGAWPWQRARVEDA